jgi:hypothetical protein
VPTGDSFFGDDRDHDQPRHRISPPQPEDGVEQQATEKYSGQIGAEVGLSRVGRHCGAAKADADALLARDSKGIAINEAAAMTIPGKLLDGDCLWKSEASESYVMYAERNRKHEPTIRRLSRSAFSRLRVFLS